MSTEIEIRNPNMPTHADALTVADMRAQVNLIQGIMQNVMQKDEHYGVIPGTKGKPTLLKPGAEKLSMTFRLVPEYRIERIDYDGGHREYIVTCRLTHAPSGTFQGEGVGSCSTMEKKYRYRNEWKNGTKTAVENPDIADTYNTVLKIAKKRSHVDAILTATAASDFFTQDLEDMPREEVREERPAQQKKAPKASGDGAKGEPPETWGQKIEAAKDYLNSAATSTEQNWQTALGRIEVKIAEWAAPHAKEVRDHINTKRWERGEQDAANAEHDNNSN